MADPDSKTCTKCGKAKPLSEYYGHPNTRDKHHPVCKECICADRKRDRLENPEKFKQREQARYIKFREKRKAKARDWYAENTERGKQTRRAHYEANRDTYATYSAKRKALLRGVAHTPYTRREIYDRDEGQCRGCQKALPHDNFEIDHIVPLSLGGPDTPANLQLMCRPCNRAKWMNLEGQIHLPV